MKQLLLTLLFLFAATFCYTRPGAFYKTIKYFDHNHRLLSSETGAIWRETKTGMAQGYAIEKYNLERKQTESYITYSDYSLKEGMCKLYTDGILQSEGNYHLNLPIGKWKIFESGNVKRTIDYTEALQYFLPYYAGELQDKHNDPGLITVQNEIHRQTEVNLKGLKFVSGTYQNFQQYLSGEIYINPNLSCEYTVTDSYRIGISFTVDQTGKVINPELVAAAPEELMLEVIRTILKSPGWVPAKEKGKPVAMKYALILTVNFEDY